MQTEANSLPATESEGALSMHIPLCTHMQTDVGVNIARDRELCTISFQFLEGACSASFCSLDSTAMAGWLLWLFEWS